MLSSLGPLVFQFFVEEVAIVTHDLCTSARHSAMHLQKVIMVGSARLFVEGVRATCHCSDATDISSLRERGRTGRKQDDENERMKETPQERTKERQIRTQRKPERKKWKGRKK